MAPDLWDPLFPSIPLMNSGNTCPYNKGFCTFFFSDNEKTKVTLPHRTQRKHTFMVKTKENTKPQKKTPKRKISLEILNQRLGHRSTRSLLAGDTENV